MSEKPEAWTAADSLIWPHLAAKLIREQHAEIERLREVLMRLQYDFKGHIKRYPEEEEVIAALRREETT
jgi:hypothetical protein